MPDSVLNAGAEPAALLGNTRTFALVAPTGAIAWAAFPYADDAPIFAPEAVPLRSGGVFELAPATPYTATRRFVGETAVLETRYVTEFGVATVHDFLPVRPQGRVPHDRLVRIVEGVSGSVSFRLRYQPRPGGHGAPEVQLDPNGLIASGPAASAILQTQADVHMLPDGALGEFTLEAREKRHFVMTVVADADPDVREMQATEPEWDLDGTFDYWLHWGRLCPFQGVQRDYVLAVATRLKSAWAGAGHLNGSAPSPLLDSPYLMVAPVALAAWGWEPELAEALRSWKPDPQARRDRVRAAWLLYALEIAQRTGLLEGTLLVPHWERLTPLIEGLAQQSEAEDAGERLAVVAGLAAASALADELMLPGDHVAWKAASERTRAGLELPAALAHERVIQDKEAEAPFSGDLAEAVWQVREELAHGSYLQARRLLDKLLLAFDPLGHLPAATRPNDVGAWSWLLWTAAEVYLQSAPTQGRVELPGDLGD